MQVPGSPPPHNAALCMPPDDCHSSAPDHSFLASLDELLPAVRRLPQLFLGSWHGTAVGRCRHLPHGLPCIDKDLSATRIVRANVQHCRKQDFQPLAEHSSSAPCPADQLTPDERAQAAVQRPKTPPLLHQRVLHPAQAGVIATLPLWKVKIFSFCTKLMHGVLFAQHFAPCWVCRTAPGRAQPRCHTGT